MDQSNDPLPTFSQREKDLIRFGEIRSELKNIKDRVVQLKRSRPKVEFGLTLSIILATIAFVTPKSYLELILTIGSIITFFGSAMTIAIDSIEIAKLLRQQRLYRAELVDILKRINLGDQN